MRTLRRLAVLLLALIAVLAACAGGAIVFRVELANAFLHWQFAARAIGAEFRLTRLDPHDIEVRNVAFGELRVASVRLRYSFRDLLEGRIEAAEIDGLEMTVNLRGDGPPLGSLQRFAAQEGGEALQWPALAFREAEVSFLVAGDTIRTTANGSLTPSGGGANALSMIFTANSADFMATGEANAVLAGSRPDTFNATANVRSSGDTSRIGIVVRSDTLGSDRPEIEYSLAGDGDLAALAPRLPEAFRPQQGIFRVALRGRNTLSRRAPASFAEMEGEANAELTLSGLALPARTGLPDALLRDIEATLTGRVTWREAAVLASLNGNAGYPGRATMLRAAIPEAKLELDETFGVRALELTNFSASASQLPTPFGTLRTAQIEGGLTGLASDLAGRLRLRIFAPALLLPGVEADDATIDARIMLSALPEGYRADLTAPARVTASELRVPGLSPLRGVSADVASSRLEFRGAADGYSFDQSAALRIPPMRLEVPRRDSAPMAFDVESGPIALNVNLGPGGALRFALQSTIGTASAPEAGVSLRGGLMHAAGEAGGEIDAALMGGAVVHTAETPAFPPLTPDMHLTLNAGRLQFGGDLRGANGLLDMALNGEHDIASGRGRMDATLNEIPFGPGGARGETISPMLRQLQGLSGRARGSASMSWDAQGLASGGRLELGNMSFEREGVTVDGLEMMLVLDRLMPPRSPPDQSLTIRRVGTGIDLNDFDLRFALAESETGAPRIAAQSLSFNVAGGRFTARGGTIDPSTGDAILPFEAAELDLEQLLRLIRLDGLSGQGRLSGVLPLRLAGGIPAIAGGVLEADAAGIVSYHSDAARRALASGGESVTLMLDALEDFHFEVLRLRLDKPAQGDSRIVLNLRGNNPAVFEGHPFEINISVTGDVQPLLDAIAAGQALTNELLRALVPQ